MNKNELELNYLIEQIKQYCSFSLGAAFLGSLTIDTNPLVIKRENKLIKEALSLTVKYGPMEFMGIRDINEILDNASKQRTLSIGDCVSVIDHLRGVEQVKNYIKQVEDKPESIGELVDSLVFNANLQQELVRVFNDYGEIKDNASATLKNIRNEKGQAEDQLQHVINRFIQANSDKLVDNIVSVRNGRSCLLVKSSYKNSFNGLIYGESGSGLASYVEPSAFIEPNNKIQSLNNAEEEEIEHILMMCSSLIGENSIDLKANLETLALLDALFAKAIWGAKEDACVASITSEKTIHLVKARHPLIDRNKVVINSYQLCDPQHILLITGPNTGGKTVSLKVIGLAVLMTYLGMPITCEEATIPLFDKVFIDVGDEQSVLTSLSTFSAHLSKLALISKEATSHSLCLLDEIGSGTDPKEGESLAIAMLNYLRNKQTMVVATTHYDRLKSYGKRHEDVLLASVQFDNEKLLPTYKYVEGLTGQSNAFDIAKKYGLEESIVKDAIFLKNQNKAQEDELIEKLEKQLNDVHLKQEQLDNLIHDNLTLKESIAKQEQQIANIKAHAMQQAKEEASTYLDDMRQKADEILKEVMESSKNAKYHEVLNVSKKLDDLSEEETFSNQDVTLHEGQFVEMKSSKQVGKLIQINKNKAIVEINGIKVTTDLNKLIPSNKKVVNKQVTSVNFKQDKNHQVKTECNLIGMHVDEALDTLAFFLDDAKVNHLGQVRVVHGEGSGALRKAVHNYLSQDNSIKEYHLCVPSEGGTGATTVVFK